MTGPKIGGWEIPLDIADEMVRQFKAPLTREHLLAWLIQQEIRRRKKKEKKKELDPVYGIVRSGG